MAERRTWQRRPLIGLLVLLVLAVTAYVVGRDVPAETDSRSGLPIVAVAELPGQVATTLGLIETDGPFPFDQDGATFENREGLLPGEPTGYYREFTVPTPGEGDRGPRRLVTGQGGEVYYTADHYDSFVQVRDR